MIRDNLYDKSAYCPFWKGTRNRTIYCEGPYKRTGVGLAFAKKAEFDRHRREYCYSQGCERCRVYRCVMEQYEDT